MSDAMAPSCGRADGDCWGDVALHGLGLDLLFLCRCHIIAGLNPTPLAERIAGEAAAYLTSNADG